MGKYSDKIEYSRKDYPEFFKNCIKEIKDKKLTCLECNAELQGHVSEVAHVLPKGYFKSVATDPDNWIPLCGQYSTGQCHTNFDTHSNDEIKKMNIFNTISEIFDLLLDRVTEKITYKTYDRYEQ